MIYNGVAFLLSFHKQNSYTVLRHINGTRQGQYSSTGNLCHSEHHDATENSGIHWPDGGHIDFSRGYYHSLTPGSIPRFQKSKQLDIINFGSKGDWLKLFGLH
jgi:hypothetical protein